MDENDFLPNSTTAYINEPRNSELLAAVLEYGNLGIPVFPCGKDKKPKIKWKTAASRDREQIKAWWTKWPDAMIGLPTGKTSKLVVLDIDIKNGSNGFDSLRSLGLSIPTGALEVKTPSGGSHFYFRLSESEDIGNSAGKIASGVDVRGSGGYVIAPPSRNAEGMSYEFGTNSGWNDLVELLS